WYSTREKEPQPRQAEAEYTKATRKPSGLRRAGYHRRGCQHDADLERRRSEFVVVIFRQRELALFFLLSCALGELLAAFAGFRIGFIARRRRAPGFDLLVDCRFGCGVGHVSG